MYRPKVILTETIQVPVKSECLLSSGSSTNGLGLKRIKQTECKQKNTNNPSSSQEYNKLLRKMFTWNYAEIMHSNFRNRKSVNFITPPFSFFIFILFYLFAYFFFCRYLRPAIN